MAERWGPVRLGNAITRVKTIFKYALDNGLIERPVRFGGEFKKPDKAVLRRHRARAGEKMLEAADLRRLIEAAGVPYGAVILLGINCGFGNTDVASLPLSALDLDTGWINFPRPKTGINRRCPLWPETVTALRDTLAQRPTPKDKADADLVFLNARGGRLVYVREKNCTDERTGQFVRKTNWTDNVSIQFAALLKRLKLHRDGIGFYTLRHVFRTIADAARDTVAVDSIMGHSDPSMAAHYRERIEDVRLKAVAENVRNWLFG